MVLVTFGFLFLLFCFAFDGLVGGLVFVILVFCGGCGLLFAACLLCVYCNACAVALRLGCAGLLVVLV